MNNSCAGEYSASAGSSNLFVDATPTSLQGGTTYQNNLAHYHHESLPRTA